MVSDQARLGEQARGQLTQVRQITRQVLHFEGWHLVLIEGGLQDR